MAPHRVVQYAPTLARVAGWAGELPAAGWLLAAFASLAAAVGHDPFTWALGMLAFASVMDYATGVATARAVPRGRPGEYSPERAARGRREKIITAVLLIGCRMMEGLATWFGIVDLAAAFRWLQWDGVASSPAIQQGGIITTIITILIATEELASVYAHRLANGGSRVLVLELVFGSVRALQKVALGRVTTQVAAWAGDDAAGTFRDSVEAMRKVDSAAHAAAHGEPPPDRRHYDAAADELADSRSPIPTSASQGSFRSPVEGAGE